MPHGTAGAGCGQTVPARMLCATPTAEVSVEDTALERLSTATDSAAQQTGRTV